VDVVVIGLGGFGSAALWRLARRGVDVVGLEQHSIGHDQGSSHGLTRLFRIACMEHPGLVPIALKSLELWTELGAETGEVLVRQTGCLNIGAPGSRPVRGALAAAAASGVPVTRLSHEELKARQPQFAGLAADDVAVWDPGGGICYPERNVAAHIKAAHRLDAEIRQHTRVTAIVEDDTGVTVHTTTGDLRADQVIVTVGAAIGTLIPSLPVTPRPIPLTWFQANDPAEFTLDNFPAFIWRRPDGNGLWGHGSNEDEDFRIKVGLDLERNPSPESAVAELSAVVAGALPGLDPRPVEVTPCVVTDSPDNEFLVGRRTERIIVATGDSGHGFKHAAGVGELLAQLATGEATYCPTDFLDPNRFD
jgi:sarcosine oxidase